MEGEKIIREKGIFGELLPETKWEARYLNSRLDIKKKAGVWYFIGVALLLGISLYGYVLVIDKISPVVTNIIEMYRAKEAASIAEYAVIDANFQKINYVHCSNLVIDKNFKYPIGVGD